MTRIFRIVPVLVFLMLFFTAPIDTDLGWHLRNGNYFLQNRKFLTHNQFTYYLDNYYFINPTALYEIIVALIYRLNGFFGLALFYAIVMTSTFLILNNINKNLPKTNFLVVLFVLLTGWHVFYLGIRSQIFTFALLVVVFWILEKFEGNKKLVFLLPFVMFLWANLHGGFSLGLIVIFLADIYLLIAGKIKKAFLLFLSMVISLITVLLNPYGLGIYYWNLLHLKTPLGNLIAEWVSPSLVIQAAAFIILVILASFLLASENKKKFFWLSSLVFLFFLAVSARRNLPFFTLTVFLSVMDIFREKLEAFEKKKILQIFYVFALIIVVLFTAFYWLPRNVDLIIDWRSYCRKGLVEYPCEAVEFVRRNPPGGVNVFNIYEWGGFLEWQLPRYKFFVDGRMPAWPTPEGKSPYTVYLEIIQARPNYQEVFDKYRTDWLFIKTGTFLDLELKNNSQTPWREIYRDSVAVIYQKR